MASFAASIAVVSSPSNVVRASPLEMMSYPSAALVFAALMAVFAACFLALVFSSSPAFGKVYGERLLTALSEYSLAAASAAVSAAVFAADTLSFCAVIRVSYAVLSVRVLLSAAVSTSAFISSYADIAPLIFVAFSSPSA